MKKISVIILCMLLLVTCVGCINKNNKDRDKNELIEPVEKNVNQNLGVIDPKEADGFRFEGTILVTEKKETTFVTYMTNKNKNPLEVNKVNVVMTNEEGKELTNIDINVYKKIEVDKTIELSSIISLDLTDVHNIEYIVDYMK